MWYITAIPSILRYVLDTGMVIDIINNTIKAGVDVKIWERSYKERYTRVKHAAHTHIAIKYQIYSMVHAGRLRQSEMQVKIIRPSFSIEQFKFEVYYK